jgi:3-isopropylmalate/(R)-2-methylmalate dehydratase small subunit
MKTVRGRAFVFGHNLDTDRIYPGRYLELTDARRCRCRMPWKAPIRSSFENSSRAILSSPVRISAAAPAGSRRRMHLKSIQVGVILAESFARIFYRNAINLGLPVMVCPDISQQVTDGDSAYGRLGLLRQGDQRAYRPRVSGGASFRVCHQNY